MTAQDAINRAIQRSALNNPDLVPMAQMLGYTSSYERAVYAMGAKYNPEYFGTSGDTTPAKTVVTDTFGVPTDMFALTKAIVKTITGTVTNVSEGDEVNLVSFRFPELEVAPRAYVRGGAIQGIGDELGAADANMVSVLTLYYSEMPISVTTLTQTLTLPDEWSDLIVVPLARLLALRDNRAADVQILDAEYNSLVATFIDHVSVYDHGATRPLIAVPAATGTRPPAGGGVQPGAPRVFG